MARPKKKETTSKRERAIFLLVNCMETAAHGTDSIYRIASRQIVELIIDAAKEEIREEMRSENAK